jgi:hypothetical protein
MAVAEVLLISLTIVAAALAWMRLRRVLLDVSAHREPFPPAAAVDVQSAVGGPQRADARLAKVGRRVDQVERRLSDDLRASTARAARRADSIEGRLQDEILYLRQEARSYEAVRSAEITGLAAEVQQLQASFRVLGAQIEDLERDMKRRIANLMEVRRQDAVRDRFAREQSLIKAIDDVIADSEGGVARRRDDRAEPPGLAGL